MTQGTAAAPRARGYALAIVLLVSVLLSALLTTMFFRLGGTTKSAAHHLGLRRSHYLCNGVVEIASDVLRQAAPRASTLEALDEELEPLREGVAADQVIIDELRAEPSGDARKTTISSGPFAGLGVIVVDLELRIALRANGVPPCRVRETQPLASLSFFQFPAFSALALSVVEDDAFIVDPEVDGVAWGRQSATVSQLPPPDPPPDPPPPRKKELRARSMSDAPLTLPAPLDERDTRPGLRFLIEQPSTPTETGSASRLALAAGVRIIDGEWYVPGPTWPGRIVYSDHPCPDELNHDECSNMVGRTSPSWRRQDAVRRLYSRYERNGLGVVDGLLPTLGAGVVSYGALDGDTPGVFLANSLCKDNAGIFDRASSCTRFVAADGPELAGKGGPPAALVDATRGGFGDVDDGGAAVLPINIDLAMLAAAMRENRNQELGTHACLPGASGGCPDAQRFNGILYVSARRGTAGGDGTGAVTFPAPDPRNPPRLPWALCGALSSNQASFEGAESPGLFTDAHFADCDDANWGRITAVRLHRASDLRAFADTGLTIVSDLPVYVQGDFNVVGDGLVRAAIIAERVTFLSSSWRDADSPPLVPQSPAAPLTAHAVRARVSLLTGVPAPVGALNVVARVLEPKVDLHLVGALGTLFESTMRGRRVPAVFRWQYPAALQDTDVDAQPPGAPRASFILSGTRR